MRLPAMKTVHPTMAIAMSLDTCPCPFCEAVNLG